MQGIVCHKTLLKTAAHLHASTAEMGFYRGKSDHPHGNHTQGTPSATPKQASGWGVPHKRHNLVHRLEGSLGGPWLPMNAQA